jgi:hypothetical protein
MAPEALSSIRQALWDISRAALLVKVTAKIDQGATPLSRISQAIFAVITLVLPDPAPARIKRGFPVCNTARRSALWRDSRDVKFSSRLIDYHSVNGKKMPDSVEGNPVYCYN